MPTPPPRPAQPGPLSVLRPVPKAATTGSRPKSGPAPPASRYPSVAWDRWFNLCRKSGTGDVDAAVALASQWVAENMQGAPSDPLERITSFYLSSFELKKALPILERLYRRSPSAEACALAWLVADLLDDHAARDRYFELMATRHKTESPRTAATWRRLHDAVKRDGGGSLDLRAIADERDSSHPNRAWLNDFIIGMFLEKRGRPVEAREFLQRRPDALHPTCGWRSTRD